MFFFLRVYLYWISVLLCFVVVFFSKIGRVLIEWRKGGYLSEFGKLGGGC